jgi:hypothetical protein
MGRHEHGFDRLLGDEQGIARVIDPLVNDVAKVRAIRFAAVDECMAVPDGLDREPGRLEPLTG